MVRGSTDGPIICVMGALVGVVVVVVVVVVVTNVFSYVFVYVIAPSHLRSSSPSSSVNPWVKCGIPV